MTPEAAKFLAPLMGVSAEDAAAIIDARRERWSLMLKGREAVKESEAMRFLRRRIELSGRLSLIEQAHWIRETHEDESSSAQPHRFKGTL